eukprot:COSAG05_NODE_4591_length_1450_cov_1.289415_2_plen_242_part_00
MLRLTKDQYAQLARSAEHILKHTKGRMKGSGPDDYGAPQMLETYLYRHPMSQLEFWVYDNGIAGGGFKSSFRKLMKQVGKRVGLLADKAKDEGKKHLEDLKEEGKKKLHEKLDEGKAQAEKVAQELSDTVMDKAQSAIAGAGHGCKGGTYGNPFAGQRHRDHEKHHKDEHSQSGGFFPTGSDTGVTGVGLNLQSLGFVSAIVPRPSGVAVPMNNHLKTFMQPPPAGGYGSMGMPISGGTSG